MQHHSTLVLQLSREHLPMDISGHFGQVMLTPLESGLSCEIRMREAQILPRLLLCKP